MVFRLYKKHRKRYNWIREDRSDMGLDMSIVRTPTNINLAELYAVREAVVNGMDWYLGDDKDKRRDNHKMLSDKVACLNRARVMDETKVPKEMVDYLAKMHDQDFASYLFWVASSVEEYDNRDNTHLEFDWDVLPGTTVIDSCSWNLKDLFGQCAVQSNTPMDDFVVELDKNRIAKMAKEWKSKGLKMQIAKWVGYFLPDACHRMVRDCMMELGVNDYWLDINDLLRYREAIMTVGKFMQNTDRLWLVSSY